MSQAPLCEHGGAERGISCPDCHRFYGRAAYDLVTQRRPDTKLKPRSILIDCDGVLTDGALTIDHRGEKMFKRFHTRDVRAIRELVFNGYEVTIVTADDWPGIHHFADKVGAEVMIARDKSQIRCGGIFPFIAVGDDAWDLPMLKRAGQGYAYCPADADNSVRYDSAVTVLETPAGRGVIAELAAKIL